MGGNPLNRIDPFGLASCSPWVMIGYEQDIVRYDSITGKWSAFDLTSAVHRTLQEGGALLTCYWERSRTITNFLFIDKPMIYERTCEGDCGKSYTQRKSKLELDQEGQNIGATDETDERIESHTTWAAHFSTNFGFRPNGLCRTRYNPN